LGFAAEFITDMQWHMHHGMREIKEEGAIFVFLDKLHGPFSVLGRELVLILVVQVSFYDLVASMSGQGREVILSSGCSGHMSFE